jgi:hypothetical protein
MFVSRGEKMLPHCSQLLDWVRWIAQDADGSWWAYEHEPNMSDSRWYENELGRSIYLQKDQPDPKWSQKIHMITKNNQ